MKKRNLALAMVLAMAMTTMGSATVFADDASDDAAGNDYTIAYVPTTMNNPFWTAMLGGIKEEMEAKGMDVDSQLVTVDANSDQATMNNYVNDLIAQEVDAIILAPMDCTAVTEALKDAYKRLRKLDVAKEVARVILPEGLTMSTMYVNGTLRSWLHYLEVREGNGTQKEHIQLANKIREVLLPVFPTVLGIKV